VKAEIAALEALALARCGSWEGYAMKLGYLVAMAKLDDGQCDRRTAILTAKDVMAEGRGEGLTGPIWAGE
jgi:hypothetical protein